MKRLRFFLPKEKLNAVINEWFENGNCYRNANNSDFH